MKMTNMTRKRFNSLIELELSDLARGSECDMFLYKQKGKQMLIKLLNAIEGPEFANKLYTLEMVDVYKDLLPSSFVLPDSLVSVNSTVVGFTLPYIEGINLRDFLNDGPSYTPEKILYLKKIGMVLEKMKDIRTYTNLKDFYIGDLHEANFMIDPITKKMHTIDIDSIKIAGNKPFLGKYLSTHSLINKTSQNVKLSDSGLGYITPDENTDIHCYILCVLNYLYKDQINLLTLDEYYEYLNYLKSLKINSELIDCFESITHQGSNINPFPYVESLTAKQLGLTPNIVYKQKK